MKAVTYKRLIDNNEHFVGFQRTVVEYLPAGGNEWLFKSLNYNDNFSIQLTNPPSNIVSMKRPKIKLFRI